MSSQNVNQRGQQAVEVSRPRESCRAAGAPLTIKDAADIVYATLPKGWRQPMVDEIGQQRALESRENARREAAEYTTDNAIDWSER